MLSKAEQSYKELYEMEKMLRIEAEARAHKAELGLAKQSAESEGDKEFIQNYFASHKVGVFRYKSISSELE